MRSEETYISTREKSSRCAVFVLFIVQFAASKQFLNAIREQCLQWYEEFKVNLLNYVLGAWALGGLGVYLCWKDTHNKHKFGPANIQRNKGFRVCQYLPASRRALISIHGVAVQQDQQQNDELKKFKIFDRDGVSNPCPNSAKPMAEPFHSYDDLCPRTLLYFIKLNFLNFLLTNKLRKYSYYFLTYKEKFDYIFFPIRSINHICKTNSYMFLRHCTESGW